MKTSPFFVFACIVSALPFQPGDVSALESSLENKALRRASGLYGPASPGTEIPTGMFVGKVGYDYHEHSWINLKLKAGQRASSAVLNVWAGSTHLVKLHRITARVKSNGRVVVLSGGQLKGSGLLPYGVQLSRAGITRSNIKFTGAKEMLKATFAFSGIDLGNMNAAVSGSCVFVGEQ